MKSRVLVSGAAILCSVSGALAQAPSTPAMDDISFPVTTASIVAAVVAAGAALLLAYFGPKVGFAFVKKLLGRLHRSV